MTTTVLIVDDHPSFRTSARRVLEEAGFEVVGEAADGDEGLRAARELRPAVVLLDVQLPDLDGFEVAGALASEDQPPAVVLTSSRDRADYDGGMVTRVGARGFVPKGELSGAAIAALLP
jgi:DNA-binding NarL/FixJ family response regulator